MSASSIVRFRVDGIPRPAGSKRGFGFVRRDASGQPLKTATGKIAVGVAIADSSGARGKGWRAQVGAAAREAMGGRAPFESALELHVEFRFPYRQADRRKSGELRQDAPTWHTSRPDASKLLRALEDACTGVVWKDDARIAIQHVTKVYSERPGASVEVRILEAVARQDALPPLQGPTDASRLASARASGAGMPRARL